MMVTTQKFRRPRWTLFLLVIVTGMALVSWWAANKPGKSPIRTGAFFVANSLARTHATTDRAIAGMQQRLKEYPDDGPVYAQLGAAYLQKARESGDPSYYQKAESALEKALADNPADQNALIAMGTLALARHQFAEALTWGERARRGNPDHAAAYGVIADAQIEMGLYPQAAQTLQQMVDLRPDMNSYARISYLRELYGQPEKAIEIMGWAVDAGTPQAENTAWARTQLANLYFSQGDLEQAEMNYQQVLAGSPGYVYALAGLGRVAAARGNMDEAISLYNQAIERMPAPEMIIALGDIYQVSGQTEAARKQHELLRAIERIYRANGVDMDLEIALFNVDHGFQISQAVEQAKQAYAARPSIYAADVLAWALYRAGETHQAQVYSQAALRLGTKDAVKLFHAGMIAYRLGEQQSARRYLAQALAINPHFSILHEAEARSTLESLNTALAGEPGADQK